MLRLGPGHHVDAAAIISTRWDHRHYANCGPDSSLIVTMNDGSEVSVRHEPQYLDGTDAYALERQILAAKGA